MRPTTLARMRAQIAAMSRPDDPVDAIPGGHEVHLQPDQTAVWVEGANWCRDNLDHARERWSRRIYTGANRDELPAVPVFAFSDKATATAFKLVFY